MTAKTTFRAIAWAAVLCLMLGTGFAAVLAEQEAEETPLPDVSVTFHEEGGARLVGVTLPLGLSLREAQGLDAGAFYPLSGLKPQPPEGRVFRHWYAVNEQLSGNPAQPYALNTPVQGDLRLMAFYEALQTLSPAEETPPPAVETPEPVAETPAPAAETAMPEGEAPAPETPAPEAEAQPAIAEDTVTAEPTAKDALATDMPDAAATEAVAAEAPVTDTPEAEPAETAAPTDAPVTQAPETAAPTPIAQEQELVSETEVDTFLVRFYGADDAALFSQAVTLGNTADRPAEAPIAPEGQVFAHWYAVDAALQGDAALPYDFGTPIAGAARLKAAFRAEDAPAAPSPAPEEDAEGTALPVLLEAALVLHGQPLEDNAYQARLTGPGLKDGLVASNADGRFAFPQVLLAPIGGEYEYKLQALVPTPQAGYAYDLNIYTIRVVVAQDEQGALVAAVSYPDGADSLTVTHTYLGLVPTVRVYLQRNAGEPLRLGDEVRFLANTLNCGSNPALQWQFSADNIAWTDIPGATGQHLDVLLTEGNALGYWRVAVTITD